MAKHLPAAVLFLFTGIVNMLTAQNLVINPGFENTSSCPTGISDFGLCLNWSNTTANPNDTCTTPDLYAACSYNTSNVNIPDATMGYQPAHSGSHYAGIILGDGLPGCTQTGDNYREYIEGQLTQPLQAGSKYQVTFYENLAGGAMWGSNSIGVFFTDTLYQHNACADGQLIRVTPQLSYCGVPVMDTVNWVPLTWIYTATGGEQYFTIGNFNNDTATNHTTLNCVSFNPFIYYYIDDVSVVPYTGAPAQCSFGVVTDSVNALCLAGTGSVSVAAYGCSSPYMYKWSTTDTTATVGHLAAGNYTVTVTDAANCKVTAAVSINGSSAAISLQAANPSVCGSYDGSVTATVTNNTGNVKYAWSNGDTTATITGLRAGVYYVTVRDSSVCTATDSIILNSNVPLILARGSIGAICNTASGTANAGAIQGAPPYFYMWSNGDTGTNINHLVSGWYQVTATDTGGCSATAAIYVASGGPTILSLSEIGSHCGGNNGSIDVKATGGTRPYTYAWNNGYADSAISGLAAGEYILTVTDSTGCTASETFLLDSISGHLALSPSSTSATCGKANGTAGVDVVSGTGPFTYIWNNADTTQNISLLLPGGYTVTVTGLTGCTAAATTTVPDSAYVLPSISINPGAPAIVCWGTWVEYNATAVNAGASPSIQWTENNTSGSNTFVFDVFSTFTDDTIFATVVSGAPCPGFMANSDTVILHVKTPPAQTLCLVTTDTTLQGNMVIWDKLDKYATDSFYIWRADSNTTFWEQIAAIGRDSLSEFYDASSAPALMSYRYAITLQDTCHNTSSLSNYHQTIYLRYLGNGNFVWTPYIVENSPSPVTSYYLYRDDLGNGNWQLLDTFTATDTMATVGACSQCVNPRYKIVVNLAAPCTPTRSGFNTITSNILQRIETGLAGNNAIADVRLLYNPVHERAEVVNISQPATLQLSDNLGRQLQNIHTAAGQVLLDMHLYAAGIYYVKVNMANYANTLKVIKY